MQSKHITSCFCFIAALAYLSFGTDTSFTKTAIINAAESINNSFLEKTFNYSWQGGTYWTGAIALNKVTGDKEVFEAAKSYGEENNWQPGHGKAILITCEIFLELYFETNDESMIKPSVEFVNSGDGDAPSCNCTGWYFKNNVGAVVDRLYMGVPPLALFYKMGGEKKYLDWMHDQFWTTADSLYDEELDLMYRDTRFIGQKSANGEKVIWSRGNGWYIAALAKILGILPDGQEAITRKNEYVEIFRKSAAALAACQGEDGAWRTNLADADEYPGPETTGTCFFTFGLARGVRLGILDFEKYYPVVKKAWQWIAGTAIYEEGTLGYCQPVGKAPEPVKKSNNATDFAAGAFLLAAGETALLASEGVVEADRPALLKMRNHTVLPAGKTKIMNFGSANPSAHLMPHYSINGQLLPYGSSQLPKGACIVYRSHPKEK